MIAGAALAFAFVRGGTGAIAEQPQARISDGKTSCLETDQVGAMHGDFADPSAGFATPEEALRDWLVGGEFRIDASSFVARSRTAARIEFVSPHVREPQMYVGVNHGPAGWFGNDSEKCGSYGPVPVKSLL